MAKRKNGAKDFQDFLKDCDRIKKATVVVPDESEAAKRERIRLLLSDFQKFSKYYFAHYMDGGQTEFGWFHKKAESSITESHDIFMVAEWAREHAKSVFFDVMIPLWLKARGELTGMIIGSANQDKAGGLLADLQAELVSNQRYIADFGAQQGWGDWRDGSFTTADGAGFWAFGRGQSPRGAREGANRPNYGVIDDIDDKTIVKNEERVSEAVDWVKGDFYGALSIKGARMVVVGNRIHRKSILAHIVGDVEPDDPKNPEIVHIKVYALENPRTHEKDLAGKPAWKERYTREQILKRMAKLGKRNALREFIHEHIVVGHIFKNEHTVWAKLPPLAKAKAIVTYNDPSFKDTKKNDFKAIVLLAQNGRFTDVYRAWVRQDTPVAMVRAHYFLAAEIGDLNARHYMEANFMQDTHLEQYKLEGERRGWQLALRPDKRKKPDKEGRIETNLEPLWEQGLLRFNIDEKHSPDMQELVNQFLGFPFDHDDGPDAVEGGLFYLKKFKKERLAPRTGGAGGTRNRKYRNQ